MTSNATLPSPYELFIDQGAKFNNLSFRGTNPAGNVAFHVGITLKKKTGKNKYYLTLKLSLHFHEKSEKERKPLVIHSEKVITKSEASYIEKQSFIDATFQVDEANFISFNRHELTGQLNNGVDKASFKLTQAPSNKPLFQYGTKANYLGNIDQKFITADTAIIFDGEINFGDEIFSGMYMGIAFNHFGKKPCTRYMRFNCNQFQDFPDAYFEGLYIQSSKMLGLLKPTLNLFSFRIKNAWFHFNPLGTEVKYSLNRLDGTNWEGKLESKNHIFSFVINGEESPFDTKEEFFKLKHTKFAYGKITLVDKEKDEVVVSLTSNYFEIETNLK